MILDRLYRFVPAMLMARRNLSRTKLRSLLAALGIVVGVLAIASLGMFGVALQYSITNELGDIGNQVQVSPSSSNAGESDLLTKRDVDQIQRLSPGAEVTPIREGYVEISYGRDSQSMEQVQSVDRPTRIYNATEGRIQEPLRSGVFVGTRIAEQQDLHPGSTIEVNGTTMRVRAVIEGKGTNFYLDPSSSIIVPETFFEQRDEYNQVIINAESGEAANQTARRINQTLNDRRERVRVQHFGDSLEQINQVFTLLNSFLIGIASISLFVAGISILNVMLMSTVERREEIGVLRAVGFQKRDVLKILLSESIALGILGGLIGSVLAMGVGLAINHYLVGDALAFFRLPNFYYIGLAFAFGLVTSVLSGLYPAWKAASEEPVDALRS